MNMRNEGPGPTKRQLSIVEPVYGSVAILPRLVEEIEAAISTVEPIKDFELLLVCDASPDGSWSVIETLSKQYAFVRGIHLRRNAGQHNATMAGLRYARGRRIVIMD